MGTIRIHYWIHHTAVYPGNSGVQRVVRALGAALAGRADVELIPVRWCPLQEAIVEAEAGLVEGLAQFGGPRLAVPAHAGRPLHLAKAGSRDGSWLLLPEVPHVDPDSTAVPALAVVLDYARYHGLRLAALFYDLIPLRAPGYEAMAPAHADYATALAACEVILPISWTAGDDLLAWWREQGFDRARLPPVRPVPLAAEICGTPREAGDAAAPAAEGRLRLLALGTVEPRKNQVAVMEALSRLRLRRPDLDFELDVVGSLHPAVAQRAEQLAAESGGVIRLLGYRPDEEVGALMRACDATVFLSLAEGYGLPVAESLWRGRPCLCSDRGSMREIAEGGGCLAIDPGDPAAIEDALEQLACDAALRHRLAEEACRRHLLDWADYGDAILAELRQLPGLGRVVVLEGTAQGAGPLAEALRAAGAAVRRLRWRRDSAAWLPGGADGSEAVVAPGDGQLGNLWAILPISTVADLGEAMRGEVEARALGLKVAAVIPPELQVTALELRALATMDLLLFSTPASRDSALALALRTLPRTATLRRRFRVAADGGAMLAELHRERARLSVAPAMQRPRRLYYWAGLTATQPFNTGVQRVTRALGAALQRAGVDLVPVKWEPATGGLGLLTAEEATSLGAWGGPAPSRMEALPADLRGEWLLLPEIVVPTVPPGSNPARLGRQLGMRVASIFYDAIPVKLQKGFPAVALEAFNHYAALFGEIDVALPISWSVAGDLRRYLAERGLPVPALVPCPLAGDLPGTARQRAPQATPAPGEPLRLLAIGTWEPRKNYPRVLRALMEARRSCPDREIELAMVGRRAGYEALDAEIERLAAEAGGVTLHSHLSDEEVLALYQRSHATIFASWEEGFGLPVLESFWRGLPCLCHEGSSLAEVAPGGGALVVDMLDEAEIAGGIARLASEEGLLARLGREAVSRPIRNWDEYAEDVVLALARTGTAPGWPLPAVLAGPARPRPLLSCAITTYNRAHWLRHSLPRLIEAARPYGAEVEVVVCDNASTDATPEVLAPYAGLPGLTLRRNPANVGMLGNLGETARASGGRYIWLIGDDDLVVDGAIGAVLEGLRAHPDVEMAYLNYAYTNFDSPEEIADASSVIRNARPIGHGGPNRYVRELREVAAYNENLFTAIYACAFRRDHALRAYGQDTSGTPFSSLLTCVPSSVYALAALADRPAWWVGQPAIVVNMNVSWLRWALIWHLERMPDLFDAAELAGVDPVRVDRHRTKHAWNAGEWTRMALMEAEPAIRDGTSVARLIERCKHLPAFRSELAKLYAAYAAAREAGRATAEDGPPEALFDRYGVRP
ncbi:glycosyltransferase [Belnapia sp. T18]|uniref:Glycosyltransferase n=1 Tax=Belnapia arida TaxID=2804533 RepID=A0ABS1U5A2_9PROT|nr:glycosyltransferase [Belnapia arida]MBL6079104.1 glycosyltransferase [Belnapia arida]